MLKTILSISGKPGLYKLVSSAKSMVIVESLTDNKKLPIHARDKVVSLGDISIYTNEDEIPLREVFKSIKEKESGNTASIATNSKPEQFLNYFGEVLPDYDKDRVYHSDVKKIIGWYNLLTKAGLDFAVEDVTEEETPEAVTEDKE